MSLLDHVSDIAFASDIPTDLIVGTYAGSISSPGTGVTTYPAKTTTTVSVNTNIPEKTFFQGVFSVDGGTTWIDFNSNIVLTLGSYSNLQTQMAYASMRAGVLTVYADNWNKTSNGTTFSSSAYTFLYKVVLFAKPGQGNITPQPVANPESFNSAYNYQKIFKDSIYNFTLPIATSTSTITHNLGYIPKFRSYIDNFSFGAAPDNSAMMDFGYFVSQFVIFQCYMDTTTIKYFVDNSAGAAVLTGTLYTRIYYD